MKYHVYLEQWVGRDNGIDKYELKIEHEVDTAPEAISTLLSLLKQADDITEYPDGYNFVIEGQGERLAEVGLDEGVFSGVNIPDGSRLCGCGCDEDIQEIRAFEDKELGELVVEGICEEFKCAFEKRFEAYDELRFEVEGIGNCNVYIKATRRRPWELETLFTLEGPVKGVSFLLESALSNMNDELGQMPESL